MYIPCHHFSKVFHFLMIFYALQQILQISFEIENGQILFLFLHDCMQNQLFYFLLHTLEEWDVFAWLLILFFQKIEPAENIGTPKVLHAERYENLFFLTASMTDILAASLH